MQPSTPHSSIRACTAHCSLLDAIKAFLSRKTIVTEECLPYSAPYSARGANLCNYKCGALQRAAAGGRHQKLWVKPRCIALGAASRCAPAAAHAYAPPAPRCKTSDPDLSKGDFQYTRLTAAWEIQDHIRRWCARGRLGKGALGAGGVSGAARARARAHAHAPPLPSPSARPAASAPAPLTRRGGAMTRMDVFDDMRRFFRKDQGGVYTPGAGAKFSEGHAVLLVGAWRRAPATARTRTCVWDAPRVPLLA